MHMDTLLTFADAVATGNIGTTPKGNSVDLKTAGRDLGIGEPNVEIHAVIDTTIVGSGATYRLELVTADNAALSSNPVVLADSGTLTVGAVATGAGVVLIHQKLPMATDAKPYKRYIGVREVVASQNTTAGKITASFVMNATKNPIYTAA